MPEPFYTGAYSGLFSIQEATETRDAHGAVVQTWHDVRDFYGCLSAVTSTEFWTARQTGGSVDYYLDCRGHEPDITPKHRIRLGTRIFQIEGVMHNINRRPHRTKLRVFEVF